MDTLMVPALVGIGAVSSALATCSLWLWWRMAGWRARAVESADLAVMLRAQLDELKRAHLTLQAAHRIQLDRDELRRSER